MEPILLTIVDNVIYGSFDTDDYVEWWRSQDFPDAIEYIYDAIWAYSSYHIAICKLISGNWAVYQSRDYGYTWEKKLELVGENVTCCARVDYGRLLMGTSLGWWETINAGKTWTFVSNQAPSCHTVREIGSNVLLALNGSYVWKSTDFARNWTRKIAANTPYPSLDGKLGRAFLGVGKTMNFTDDFGESWLTGDVLGVDPWNITHRRESGASSEVITNIVATGINGMSPGQITWVVQALNKSTNIYRHYYYTESADITGWGGARFVAKFDALYTPDARLDHEEVMIIGTPTFSKTVTFTGMKYDLGIYTPKIVTSSDGGITWIDHDVANAVVYSSPDGSGSATSYITDTFVEWHWTGQRCHNSGHWVYDGGYVDRGISFDMDFATSLDRDITYSFDVVNALHQTESLSMDIINMCINNISIDTDMLIKDTHQKINEIDAHVMKRIEKTPTMDMVLVFLNTKVVPVDQLILKTCTKGLIMDVLNEDTNSTSLSMDVSIQDVITYDILNNSERYNWQAPAIGYGYKKRSYPIWDSRNETYR